MKIAAIIPAYKVKSQIINLLKRIGKEVDIIILVDDACPEKTGEFVKNSYKDSRLIILFNKKNLGVGGAVKRGFKKALELNAEIIIKIDGDGQMNPELIPYLIKPIINSKADFSKGNRFFYLTDLKKMPGIRLFGNSILSLFNKIVNGYWKIMDPTNGFIAIHRSALKLLPLDKIDNRYFFESDLLFRLGTIRAVVTDIPMKPKYEDEKSSLNILKILFVFPPKYFKRIFKRIFYIYFLRDFNIGSVELIFGNILFLFGLIFGLIKWIHTINTGIPNHTGTIMISLLSIILGFQLLLSFINYDINNIPQNPIQKLKH